MARAASGGCRSGIPETSSSYNGSDGTSVGLKTNADGSTTVQMSTSRQALVNMRLGYALAFSGAVSISGKVDGISLTRAELAAEELRTKASADEEFAKIMKQEIDRYRTLETGFDTPQACVQIAFSPTSGSTPVSAGRSGSFQVQLDLKSGSGPPTGKWKLVSQRAAAFSPPTSSGHQTTFRYSVPSNTSATQIAASLNATSKAGVATGDWTQPIKPTGLYLRIVGYTRSEQSSTTDGQMSITATLAGGQPGPVTAVPACTSPASCLTDVELDANVTSTESGYVTGPPDTCPGGRFDFAPTSFPNTLRLTVEFDRTGTSPATSGDGMLPSVGDAVYGECGVYEFGDAQSAGGSVPLADLLSGNQVTLRFSGSGTTPSSIHPSVSISWMLSESVTVQRVQPDGTPLTAAATNTRSSR